ncbi:kinase [Thraustotheca clavata]|uniref:Kinase n=1 Tax=Thraustotheca clavata TaxID=74557 RepID=A0A1W0A143_9STRA|nr:kinase [Thraustotheca clavata]
MGVVTDDGNLCIVTEYLPGGSLFNLLHDPSQSLTWQDQFLQFAIDICEGMAYMHAQTPPILHRDLKSPNILITEYGTTAKIADFGFARKFASTMSSKGTQRWCAPEILSGDSFYTEKVDDFSQYNTYINVIVLWEMCTREIPYAKERGEVLRVKIVNDNHRPSFPSNMPNILEDIYEECVSSMHTARPNFAYLLTKLRGRVTQKIQSSNRSYPVNHPKYCQCLIHRGRRSELYQ